MKVIHSRTRWLAQTETWLHTQAAFLPPSMECHVVCGRVENLDQFPMPHIHSLWDHSTPGRFVDKAMRKLGFRDRAESIARLAKRIGAQILHSHFGNGAWADLDAAERAGLKHVVTFYGYDLSRLPRIDPIWRERYAELFERVDRVLCEGPHMGGCVRDLGCPSEKLRVHHLGIRVNEIEFQPRRWSAGETLRVLIAASFREKKGIPYALEALTRLIRGGLDIELTMIGDAKGPEAEAEKATILDVIQRNGMNGRVRQLGYQPHRVMLTEAYDHHLFLSPSVTASDGDTEGGVPVSIIEMAATGMPVVSTTHCDIPEVIEDGVSGVLAPERDVEGLVERMTWLIERAEQWPRMAAAGRAHIEREYDARTQGERLAGIYAELLGETAGLGIGEPSRTGARGAETLNAPAGTEVLTR